jgi:rhodanese-related sulfurtransferase
MKNRRAKLSFVTLFIAGVGLVCMFGGCLAKQTTSSKADLSLIKDVTPVQSNSLIQRNQENAKFVILDVRTPQEYSEGHIAGAVNIDYYASDFKNRVDKLDKTNIYLIYCRTGIRSAAASKIISGLGFKNIYNMMGGITDWQTMGFPVVK